jgi:hypothetical protein
MRINKVGGEKMRKNAEEKIKHVVTAAEYFLQSRLILRQG